MSWKTRSSPVAALLACALLLPGLAGAQDDTVHFECDLEHDPNYCTCEVGIDQGTRGCREMQRQCDTQPTCDFDLEPARCQCDINLDDDG